jgi:uncharacterized protein YjbI with pentapeptide repeats
MVLPSMEDRCVFNSIVYLCCASFIIFMIQIGCSAGQIPSNATNNSSDQIIAGISSINPNIIQVNEILSKIERGEKVAYDGATIIGNLDLNKLNLQKWQGFQNNSPSEVFAVGSHNLIKLPKWNGVERNYMKRYTGRDIPQSARGEEYAYAIYNQNGSLNEVFSPITITNSTIKGYINIEDALFRQPVNFKGTCFENDTKISTSIFLESAAFRDVSFFGQTDLGGSIFLKSITFNSAQFKKNANFAGIKFYGTAIFTGAEFGQYASFENALFCEYADFSGSIFREAVDFVYAEFRDDVGLGGALVEGDTNFENAIFNKNIIIYKAKFTQLYAPWSLIKNHVEFKTVHDYLSLIKNYKEIGQFSDADDCYYDFRSNSMNSTFDYLALITCGYGVRIQNTIMFALGILVLFGLLIFLRILNLRAPLKDVMKKIKQSFALSAIVLIMAPAEWYFCEKEVYDDMVKRVKYILYLERLIGWCIMAILIAVLSRMMIR